MIAAGARVVVVGGGISGLTAAFRLACLGYRVELLEASDRTGGKLRSGSIAGVQVDVGAEAMLARRPEAVGLAREVGLADALRDPGTTRAGLWARDGLRRFPRPMVQGVPGDLNDLRATGILTDTELARAALDSVRPGTPVVDDVSVAQYVGDRLGFAVVDRLVEPLLGGVYAGRADELSMHACLPQLWDVLTTGSSLMAAVRASTPAPPADPTTAPPPVPVFAGLDGGVAGLATGVRAAAEAAGALVRTGVTVRELHPHDDGWQLVCGSARAPEIVVADAVLLACPAVPSSRLLREVAPDAATGLAGIPYASMAILTLAVRRDAPFDGSGFLAGAGSLAAVKGATYSSTKWPWLADRAPEGALILRASVGRRGDEALLQRDDAELVDLAVADLQRVLRTTGDDLGPVVDSSVTRWGGGLPQYAVGHLDRVERIRASIAAVPGLAVAGAAYQGVGIPACIASADRAVDALTR
ncbi:MAG TPA: protoporphyrinogen oxidase [Actinopolymorphaceae bacterium]